MSVGGLLGTAGGVVGYEASQGDVDQQQADLQAALQAYQNIQIPTIAEQQWNLAQEQQAGTLTPQQIQTMQMGPNAMSGIITNPAYTQAQQNALATLGQLGQGGLTNAEKQNLIMAQQQAAGQAQSGNAAIAQQMAARGMGGSGVQLAAQLANNQNASNQLANNALGVNSMAQQNALNAIAQQGGLSTQMQGQQFGQQAAIAQAQNAINQFNTANAQNVAASNTQALNQAQAANLANAQNIGNTNVGLTNQQIAHNTGLYQQQFQDEMARAQGEAGGYNNLAGFEGQQAQNLAGMWAGLGSGLGDMATSGGYGNNLFGGSSGGSSGGYMSPSGASASNNWGAGSYAMPDMGSGAGMSQAASLGLFAEGGMVNPPDYSDGGGVHDNENLNQLKKAFDKFITEEENEDNYAKGGNVQHKGPAQEPKGQVAKPKNPPSMAPYEGNYDGGGIVYPAWNKGGEVSTLGMNSYAKGGSVSPEQKAIMAHITARKAMGLANKPAMPMSANPLAQKAALIQKLAALKGAQTAAPVVPQPTPNVGAVAPGMGTPPTGVQMLSGGGGAGGGGAGAGGAGGSSGGATGASGAMGGASGGHGAGMGGHGVLGLGGGIPAVKKRNYDEGGMVTPEDLAPYMPTKEEEEQSGFPPGPQRASYIALKRKQAADRANSANSGYADGGEINKQRGVQEGYLVAPTDEQRTLAQIQAGATGSPVSYPYTPKQQMTGTSPMSPEDAADMALNTEKPVTADQINAALKKMAQKEKGMYEGGNLTGLPHAPPAKKADSNDGEQYGMDGINFAVGGRVDMDMGGAKMFDGGGDVKARVSSGERYYTPKQAKDVADGRVAPKQTGRVVPGKAPYPGDTPKNDIVHANLKQGGLVVPRTKEQSSDNDILEFVRKVREGKR